ncbi:MAG: hypothetical protein EKK46_12215 [Rhodocyclaceae bacterium]|nr:MAG: hypothetical protein EKK46_12215 [Rhodocyclaceae bacterium]
MNRESMIEALVLECSHRLMEERSPWLLHILESGFRGFASMSDAELRQEMMKRHIGAARMDTRSLDVQVGGDDDFSTEELADLIRQNHWLGGRDID